MIPWLRSLAEKGDKGGVTNVNARSLGRVADELERQCAENSDLKGRLATIRSWAKRTVVTESVHIKTGEWLLEQTDLVSPPPSKKV